MQIKPIFISLSFLSVSAHAFDDFSGVVFTPNLMDQSVADAPGSTTIITADDIERLSIKTVPDILRLVPGFSVRYSSPFAHVNRGTIDNNSRRLQVLVDGVSEVNPLVGIVNWETLPAPVDAIERIEVVRSQSSSAHGANAFVATINIITKSPTNSQQLSARGWATERGGEAYVSDGTKIGSTYISGYLNTNRYNRFETYSDGETERHDTQSYQKLGVQTSTQTDAGLLSTKIAGSTGDFEHDIGKTSFGADYPVPDIDTLLLNASLSQTMDDHVVTWSAYRNWRDWNYHWPVTAPKAFFYPDLGLLYRDNEELVVAALSRQPLPSATPEQLARLSQIFQTLLADPTSFQSVTGDTNTDYRYESRQYSVSDIWTFSDQLRLSSSIQIDQKRFLSETYGDGLTKLNKSRIFSNAEYKPTSRWTFNAGTMAESVDYRLEHPEFSPRVGANYHVTPHTTIKTQYAVGKRLIDGIEILEYNQVPTHFDQPIYGSTRQTGFYGYFDVYQNPDLVEGIESSDISLIHHSDMTASSIRFYKERMFDLLELRVGTVGTQEDTFSSQSKGVEVESRLSTDDFIIGAGGHYQDSESTAQGYGDYFRYGGHAFFSAPVSQRSDVTVAYYGTSPHIYSSYDRFDLILTQKYAPGGDSLVLQFGASHHREMFSNIYVFTTLDAGIQDQNEVFFRVNWTPNS
jgi:outer membrane receptor protein involved in Fe transport